MNISRINTSNNYNKPSFKQQQKPNTDKKYYNYDAESRINYNYNVKKDNKNKTKDIFSLVFGFGCLAFAFLNKGIKY